MTAPTAMEKTIESVFPGDQAEVIAAHLIELAAADTAASVANALKRDSAFTPTTSGDWPVQPTTIQNALDKLAARVKALEP